MKITITGRESLSFFGLAFGGFAESEKRIAAYSTRKPAQEGRRGGKRDWVSRVLTRST